MQAMLYEYLDQKYKKLTVLGNSEKKSAWLAQDAETGQIFVKKYISLDNADVYERLKNIRHRNLIPILHVARGEQDAVVIMEYVSGQTMEEHIREQKTFLEKDILGFIIQLLEGLREVHKTGIVHRDINPRNLLISTDGVVKILDFDIGRIYKKGQGQDTRILGTAGYAAPEQFGFMQSDARTDIYAVGVLMNVMLSGENQQRNLGRDRGIDRIIQKCMQIDPDKRCQSADELILELAALQDAENLQEVSSLRKIEGLQNFREQSIWPGFRTGILWKKIVAGAYYALMGMVYSIGSLMPCRGNMAAMLTESAALFIYIWLSALLPLNFLHWMERMPLVRRFGRMGRVFFGAAVWTALFMGGYELEQYVYMDMLQLKKL